MKSKTIVAEYRLSTKKSKIDGTTILVITHSCGLTCDYFLMERSLSSISTIFTRYIADYFEMPLVTAIDIYIAFNYNIKKSYETSFKK